jgi:hypothetical protein
MDLAICFHPNSARPKIGGQTSKEFVSSTGDATASCSLAYVVYSANEIRRTYFEPSPA